MVVDATLYECTLDGDGNPILVEVEESEFLFEAFLPQHEGCYIKIIRNTRLDSLAEQAKSKAGEIRKEFDPEIQKFFKNEE